MSITSAINSITDQLAGEDVTGGKTVEGAINALAPYMTGGGGGGDLAVVTLTGDGPLGPFTADLTGAEIYEAAESGKTVLGKLSIHSQMVDAEIVMEQFMPCAIAYQSSGGVTSYNIMFTWVLYNNTGLTVQTFSPAQTGGGNVTYNIATKTIEDNPNPMS